jgi:hypothetical protein
VLAFCEELNPDEIKTNKISSGWLKHNSREAATPFACVLLCGCVAKNQANGYILLEKVSWQIEFVNKIIKRIGQNESFITV